MDGIHFNVRLDENRLCALVIVGVRADGTKELVSITDGHRESTESWADVLRDLRRRGMRAPTVAVGDGALGFWAALRDVFPETVEARCWVHKAANVLNALPKSAQPAARRAMAEIRDAEDRDHALAAIEAFKRDYGAKWPKAVAKIVDDAEVAAVVLRLPGRALGPSQDHQPDRVDLRHRPVADQGDQGSRLESRRPGHGLQADRGRPGPVAVSQRPPPRRPGPGRRHDSTRG